MNISLFISMLFILQAIYWLVGKYSAKKNRGVEDYFLAGRDVSFFPLMMTFLAALVGGGVVLGAAEEAYRYGWAVILYPFGAALGLIALGAGVGRKLAQFQVATIAQLFEEVYQSKRLRQIASVLSIVTLFMILAAQVIASRKFLVSIGCASTPLFLLFWATVIFYTAQGGLRAVISTDMVQAALFTVVFIGCFLFVNWTNGAGVFVSDSGTFSAVSDKLCGWLLMPLLFIVVEQDMGQRCFAAASPQTVSRATFWAGVIMMAVCVAPVYFGVLAKVEGLEVPAGASVLMTALESKIAPWGAALAGCAILAAVISTATSLINAISSNLFNDFGAKGSIKRVRLVTMAVAFGSVFFTFYFDTIIDLLVQSFELSVSSLFVPVVFALGKRKGGFYAALLAIAAGALGFIGLRFAPLPLPREILSIFLSLAGYGLGWGIDVFKLIKKEKPI